MKQEDKQIILVDLSTKLPTLQEIQAEDSIHKRKVLIGRYLLKRMEYYEKQIAKSSDTTQCDDIDWVMLAGDMFDTLQMIEQNFLLLRHKKINNYYWLTFVEGYFMY